MTVDTPQLLVENKFAAGRYRFQLVAIDEGGLESLPAELVVSVLAPAPPPPPPPTQPPPPPPPPGRGPGPGGHGPVRGGGTVVTEKVDPIPINPAVLRTIKKTP